MQGGEFRVPKLLTASQVVFFSLTLHAWKESDSVLLDPLKYINDTPQKLHCLVKLI